ncbi:hypothetical protein PED39_00980 [Methanomassiliicoccales archaeon LGM-RCC1]|nr:hypothetical protein PED39_00980 [Methanomassiliicoccales archaeon LGM-RCC1]
MGEEAKTRIMIRVTDNMCRSMDAFAGSTHASRPDVVVDACRKFYTEICTREMLILDAVEERKVSREVGQAVYYEELESYIETIREDYEATAKMGRDSISILVVFPYMLLEQMNRVIERTRQFKNHQDFIKIALMYFFASQRDILCHEKKIEDFLKSSDIKGEVDRIREMIRNKEKPVQ